MGVVDAAAVEYVTVPVSEMRTPVRLYAAAQAERDRPWSFVNIMNYLIWESKYLRLDSTKYFHSSPRYRNIHHRKSFQFHPDSRIGWPQGRSSACLRLWKDTARIQLRMLLRKYHQNRSKFVLEHNQLGACQGRKRCLVTSWPSCKGLVLGLREQKWPKWRPRRGCWKAFWIFNTVQVNDFTR